MFFSLQPLYRCSQNDILHEQPTNHISLKNRPRCYTKSPTAQDTFQSIPGLISCTRVTGRLGLLFHAENGVRWLALYQGIINQTISSFSKLVIGWYLQSEYIHSGFMYHSDCEPLNWKHVLAVFCTIHSLGSLHVCTQFNQTRQHHALDRLGESISFWD